MARLLTDVQLQYAVDKRVFNFQAFHRVWINSESHNVQGDDNQAILDLLQLYIKDPFVKIQIDLGLTTSQWYDMNQDDVVRFHQLYTNLWGPDLSPPWSGLAQPVGPVKVLASSTFPTADWDLITVDAPWLRKPLF